MSEFLLRIAHCKTNLAETRRFELLKGLTPYLVSSEAHSTGLCDVSKCEASLPPLIRLVNQEKLSGQWTISAILAESLNR